MMVISGIFGGKDSIHPISGIDGHMFTDYSSEKVAGSGWKRRALNAGSDGPALTGKRPKMLIWMIDDITVWVDGSIQIVDPEVFMSTCEEELGDCDIALSPHPDRTTVDAELKILGAKRNRYKAYLEEGFKDDVGLFCGGLIVRRRTPRMIAMCQTWFQEMSLHSIRDQVSLPYVLWKHGVTPRHLSISPCGDSGCIKNMGHG